MTTDVTIYPDLSAWTDEGEELAYTAAHLPYRIGEWYTEGVQQFGAAAVIRALAENRAQYDTGGKPDHPYLARVKLHTIQNYSTVYKAIQAEPSYQGYDFWHVESVLGIPNVGKRLELLEAGKKEGMGVVRFRRYRDEELGREAAPPPDNGGHANGKVIELTQANYELTDTVQDYARLVLERDARIAALQAQIDAAPLPFVAPYPARYPGSAPDTSLADSVGTVYPRGEDHAEWAQAGRPVCQHCGQPLYCAKCGGVQG